MRTITLLFAIGLAACCNAPDRKGTSGGGVAATQGAVPKAEPPKVEAPPTAVDIKTLLGEYKDNEVRADAQFKGKRIQVTGKVGDIKKDILDKIFVTVGTGKQFEIPEVQCYFDDEHASKAATLSKGQTVTVKGTVKGLMMNVLVEDCEF